jgi:hypothetical protein
MGFGNGPFGSDPFGQDNWARRVLYDAAPALYREADKDNGFLLRKYAEGQYHSFSSLKRLIRDFGSLRDPLEARSEYTEAEFLTLGVRVPLTGNATQAGNLGSVATLGIFSSADRTAQFTQADIGRQLVIRRSSVSANNQKTFRVSSVVSQTEILVDPPISLDAGPMRWELRELAQLPSGQVEVEVRGGNPTRINPGWMVEDGSAQYQVVSRQSYWQPVDSGRLLNEKDGSDGVLAMAGSGAVPAYTLYSPTYSFQVGDIGKQVLISGADDPFADGLWEIVGVEPLGPGGAGVAVFGRLTAPGLDNDVQGKTDFVYQQTADRLVTVALVLEDIGNLPLAVSTSDVVAGRLDVTVRLATDASAEPVSTPAEIGAALAADPIASKYVAAGRSYTGAGETPVAPLQRTFIKPGILTPQAGPVYWALRPFARLVLRGDAPRGTVDAEGFDLEVTGVQTIVAPSASFSPGDEGKTLSIRGSPDGNDGDYEIDAVISPTSVTLQAQLQVGPSECHWTIRSTPINQPAPTRLNPSKIEVIAHADSMLDRLAYDFGIRVDGAHVEERQRAWVRQLPNWIAVKGTEQSIVDVAHLNGFTASVSQLYSIPAVPDIGTGLSGSVDLLFVGDGRIGAAGALTDSGGTPRFTDAGVTFTSSDVGRVVSISSAATPANNNFFVIAAYISPNEVQLHPVSVGGTLAPVTTVSPPDPNNGALLSTIGEIYTTTPLLFPLFDDVDYDYLAVASDVVGLSASNRPGLDVLCSVRRVCVGNSAAASDAVSTNPGNAVITSVSTVGQTHTVFVQGDDLSMVLGGGWRLIDSSGTEFYFDTVPTLVSLGAPWNVFYTDLDSLPQVVTTYPNAVYSVTIQAAVPPAAGPVAFAYVCQPIYGCDFCASYKVAIRLTAGPVLDEGVLATTRAYERCIRLLEDALPIHVEPVYTLELPFRTRPLLTGISSSGVFSP